VIGRVAPTAASLGVAFGDLLAAIASITGQGLDTAGAVTGLKAALANIIKPTSDATKEAARLGIKFDAATLRARGLTGFLDAITSSAKFNADSLAKLFGSVEALNAITALTANHSATFTAICPHATAWSGSPPMIRLRNRPPGLVLSPGPRRRRLCQDV
jgi:TP901 family phage tail tape measure protein